jgi:hypothetical protein
MRRSLSAIRRFTPEATLEGPLAGLREALGMVLKAEAKARSVIAALQAQGDRGSTEAFTAAARIAEALATIKREAGVEYDQVTGPDLLARLITDPSAALT